MFKKLISHFSFINKYCISILFLTTIIISGCSSAQNMDDLLEVFANNPGESELDSPFNGAILLAKSGKIVFRGAYGLKDRENGVPNTYETIYPIASVTKQFTAMLAMILHEKRQLNINDKISKFISKPPNDKQNITIYQLLTHTSGLPHYEGFQQIGLSEPAFSSSSHTPRSLSELVLQTKLISEPGRLAHYSSPGYMLLGYILEIASGKSFSELLKLYITNPLRMRNTGYTDNSFIKKFAAKGYRFKEKYGLASIFSEFGGEFVQTPFRDQTSKYAAGGMHSTVDDLYRWTKAIRNNELISKELSEIMLKPDLNGFACGWIRNWPNLVEKNTDARLIHHSGALAGYRSSLALYDDGTTIIFLANLFPIDDEEFIHQTHSMINGVDDENGLNGYPNWGSYEKFQAMGGLTALKKYFNKLSKLCGYKVKPSLRSLVGIIKIHLDEDKVQVADSLFRVIKASYVLTESRINQYGYDLLGNEEYCTMAINFFKLNTKFFGTSANSWDSLGEGFEACGKMDSAKTSYEKAIEIGTKTNEANLELYRTNLLRIKEKLKK